MSDVLRIEDLDTAGQWLHFDVGPHLEQSYRQVTGWAGAERPWGLAVVVGRLAYTRGRTMPPGGVLREIALTTLGPLPANGRYLIRVDSDVRVAQAQRRRVRRRGRLRPGLAGRELVRITPELIEAWAEVVDDHNPLHVDAAFARCTPFGQPIVHGSLLFSLACDAMQVMRPSAVRGGTVRMRFRAPVLVGSAVDVEVQEATIRLMCGNIEPVQVTLEPEEKR